MVNAIVDTLKTAFPRSEPQSPTEDNDGEVDGGKASADRKSRYDRHPTKGAGAQVAFLKTMRTSLRLHPKAKTNIRKVCHMIIHAFYSQACVALNRK